MIETAIEVFVRGFASVKSRTHLCEILKVGPLWCVRDSERRNAAKYRNEEWVAFNESAAKTDAIARRESRGRFVVCPIIASGEDDRMLRDAYKRLGYRLLATEPFFAHQLRRIPRSTADIRIERLRTAEQARLLAKATRSRPIPDEQIGRGGIIRPDNRVEHTEPVNRVQQPGRDGTTPSKNRVEPAESIDSRRRHFTLSIESPYRQYLAFDHDQLVGWVRSVDTPLGNWCSSLYVLPTHRRQGIGKALLSRMLRDDRAAKVAQSVLLSSHAGALLYPRVGYDRLGTLYILKKTDQRPGR